MATANQVWLPEEVERGAVVSLVTSTATSEGDDGLDDRYPRFPYPKLRATISYWNQYIAEVEKLFITQNGPAYSFLFRPPLERLYTVERQQMGDPMDGESNDFQCERTWDGGEEGRSITKPIWHPRGNTVRVWVDDVELDETDFAVSNSGLVTLDVIPDYGAIIEASFEYDTAVHFVSDELDVSLPDSHRDNTGTVTPIEEIRQLTIEEVFNE